MSQPWHNLESHYHRLLGFPITFADIGDQLLEHESFEYRPTQEEMKALELEGVSLLFIDCLKGK